MLVLEAALRGGTGGYAVSSEAFEVTVEWDLECESGGEGGRDRIEDTPFVDNSCEYG